MITHPFKEPEDVQEDVVKHIVYSSYDLSSFDVQNYVDSKYNAWDIMEMYGKDKNADWSEVLWLEASADYFRKHYQMPVEGQDFTYRSETPKFEIVYKWTDENIEDL